MSDSDERKYYTGAGPVPPGKERAPLWYAAKTGRISYYGICAVDPMYVEFLKNKKESEESLKIKYVENSMQAKQLLKEIKFAQAQLKKEDINEEQKTFYENKMKKYEKRKKIIVNTRKKLSSLLENYEKMKNMENNDDSSVTSTYDDFYDDMESCTDIEQMKAMYYRDMEAMREELEIKNKKIKKLKKLIKKLKEND